jgi:hypothetical protein
MAVIPLLALFTTVAPAPPPPPPALFAPPIVTTPYMRSAASRTTETVSVQLRHGGRVLWSGDLSRASDGTATMSQQVRESQACANGDARFVDSRLTSFSVTISPDYQQQEAGAVRVSIERTAPFGDDKDCRSASSTVRLESRTVLPQGKAVTLEGEGGLSVTLIRR